MASKYHPFILFIIALNPANAIPLDSANSFIVDSTNQALPNSLSTDSKIAASATAITISPQISPSASQSSTASNPNIGDAVLSVLGLPHNTPDASTVIVTITPTQSTVTSTVLSTTVIKPSRSIVTLTTTIAAIESTH